MIKRDYLERLIEQLAAVAARALGLAKEGRHDEARREIEAAYAHVGISALIIDRLDPASVRLMSGDRTDGLIALLEHDAEVATLAGNDAQAKRRRALAAALRT